MPELKCTVQTCLHNQNYYCDLDSIKVGGSSAKHAQDTCCDSFEERKDGNSYSNTMKEASPKSEIDCKATECTMNSVTVMPEKSVWKAEMPVDVRRQNAQHLVVAVIS